MSGPRTATKAIFMKDRGGRSRRLLLVGQGALLKRRNIAQRGRRCKPFARPKSRKRGRDEDALEVLGHAVA
jgi:hypothetical protein